MENKISKKHKILLVWNYDRKDWIQPFLDLRDQFHFVFLSKFKEKDDQLCADTKNIEKIYWTNYSSPGSILNAIKPQVIIFMSLNNFPDIILNRIAQKKSIPTVILQHGLFYSQDTYKERRKLLEGQKKVNPLVAFAPKTWQAGYLFYGMLQGFGISGANSLFRYLLQKRSLSDIIALEKNKFAERMPDKVIVYSKKNALVFKQRDGIDDAAMIEIGNPTLDKYFKLSSPASLPFNNYFLLIDIPLHVEKSVSSGFGFSKRKAKDIYERILSYAKSRGKKLVIKLHPFSYREDDLLSDPDLFYGRDQYDSKDLIACAAAVISFPSTLAIPAIYFKPVLLLKFAENSFLDFINRAGLPVISVETISDESPEPVWNQAAKQFVIEECLYRPDGRSLERLQKVLNDLCKA